MSLYSARQLLVLQSFYQVGVHGVQAVVCRVCVFWGGSDAMLRTAVGGVRAVCDKDCSKSYLRISKVIFIWLVIIYLRIKQHSTFTINTKKNHAPMKKRAT